MLNLCVKLWYVRDWYVTKLCVKLLYVKVVCEREEAGGGGRRHPGYRIKNKNPTQSCGEKTQCFATFLPFRTPASSFF